MLKIVTFVLSSLLLTCNFIPVSVPNTTIKGSEIKSELRKESQTNIIFPVSASSTALTSSLRSSSAKQCPGFTTDTVNPDFKLPQPSEFTNVNLSGTITGIANGTVTQNWLSEPITTVSYIDVRLITSLSCRYRLNAEATLSIGTFLNSSDTIAVETVPSTLSIACYTSFNTTTRVEYTISLNPRPQRLAANLPLADLNSTFNLISETTAPIVAGIKDDTMYTYESFEKCKANFTLAALAYSSAAPEANARYQECGIYNPTTPQFIAQGIACDLKEAKFIETN
ncbi:MAG: hypothetical protein O9264_06230 [Leptospira sp.]|nr:hypothetical protein [Leptospira sp.]